MGVSWTKEQQEVIRLRNRNILVSAAAGSGKTAVLVERIITRIVRDDPPMDVEQFLIVTFTEAAASEMKERVLDAIEKELDSRPEDARLRQQAALVHTATITTIHSFCLSVIREHFHTIGLDPGFRIAEEGELKLLKQDVLKELLEEYYAEGTEEFLSFVETLSPGRDDRKLEELILSLYEFSRGYPRPEAWFADCERMYAKEAAADFEASALMETIRQNTGRMIKDVIQMTKQAMDICDEPGGPLVYREALEKDMERFEAFTHAATFEEMHGMQLSAHMEKLGRCTDKTVEKERKELVQSIRKEVKSVLSDMEQTYLYAEKAEMLSDMQRCEGTVKTLLRLVKAFAEKLEQKKSEKNMIDFGDMEHFALRILTEEKDGKLVPSAAAKLYQERFGEIMIDEYQDSNLIQEAILTSVSRIERGEYNIFMVGDVKQSIYSFRLSRPELFMEKYNTYDKADSARQRIDLHKNFRSRKEVLDAANFIFAQIMTEGLGGIAYDDNAALYVGASYEDRIGTDAEVLIVDPDRETEDAPEAEESARELEAKAVALRIKELVGAQEVFDKSTGAYRKCSYRDIVILTRSVKGWTDVFSKVLNREGIPTWTGSKEGYFKAQEIRLILDYLKVLNNPKQDIPLAAVLTSFIGKLTEEELAVVKSGYPDETFHRAVFRYMEDGADEGVKEKLCAWNRQLQKLRALVPFTAIHDLIWKLLEETGYRKYVFALPDGIQRRANLDMLVEKACAFEKTSYKGVFHFIRYMEQLEKYEVDYGEANIADEQADTVRLMSIHKSKGLEFPVVFVAGMGKRFNLQDSGGAVIWHHRFGIGMDAVDLKNRTKKTTILKQMIKKELVLDSLGEELRILYVALTRAKEKLILSGTLTKPYERLEQYRLFESTEEKTLSYTALTGARNYFSWVLPSLVREFPGKGKNQIRIRVIGLSELSKADVSETVMKELTREVFENWDVNQTYDEAYAERIREQFAYEYPFARESELKLKFTVSELKKRENQDTDAEQLYREEDVVPLLPNFLKKEEPLSGASRGTAYHKVMELLDFEKEYNPILLSDCLDEFVQMGKMSEEMRACIVTEDILGFLQTGLADRMKKAAKKKRIFAEQPFVLGVDVGEVYEEETSEGTILIQGIIDAYFEEGEALVLLDYKTDKVRSGKELSEKYHAQLAYYAKALERMTGKQVKEKLIYSFTLHEIISV